MKLFHQCGHCTKWNIEALKESVGDGLIISPVHEPLNRVHGFASPLKKKSFFDPQFYLPNSQKTKLHSYDFFPEAITGGFTTVDFGLVALESAKRCVEFQASQSFERIVIPARFVKQMVSKYTEQQEAYSVVPFLKEIGRQKIKRPIFLTLALTSHMVEDSDFRTSILNWVTSFPEISGVYLIVENERSTKQITSEKFLLEMMVLITELRNAKLQVVVGYTNTESLLYLLTGEIDITMGAYENTRMFSLDKFVESDEERRGPRARIYLSGLLNWIQFGEAKTLMSADVDLWNIVYQDTPYADAVLKQPREPSFNQAPLYNHYFACFAQQVDELRGLTQIERFKKLSAWIKRAITTNEGIADLPLAFERHGRGEHLQAWLNVANTYFRSYLKS